MWRDSQKVERVCGRVFLILFLFALPLVWVRIFLGGKIDAFDNEMRFADTMPELNAHTVLHGEFQEQIEGVLADQMPASETIRAKKLGFDDLIFDNLSWIARKKDSNYRLVGDDVYVYKDYDYLLRPLLKDTWTNFKYNDSEESAKIRNVLERSNNYFGNLPIKNKYIYIITTDQAVDFDHLGESSYVDQILSYYPSFKSSRLEIPDFDTYMKYYLRNDHHWNYEGSYTGYKDIIKLMLGEDEKVMEPVEKVVFDYNTFGSKSMNSHYYKFKEKFTAYRFDFAEREVEINGNKTDEYGDQEKHFKQRDLRSELGSIGYGNFYGLDPAVVHYNYKQPEKSNLIMIGHSDTNAINGLVASHFNETWVIDPRFCSRAEFEKIISENNIDYLLLAPNTSDFIPEMQDEPKGYEGAIQ